MYQKLQIHYFLIVTFSYGLLVKLSIVSVWWSYHMLVYLCSSFPDSDFSDIMSTP